MSIEEVRIWLRRYLWRWRGLDREALYRETNVYISRDHWETIEHDLREGR